MHPWFKGFNTILDIPPDGMHNLYYAIEHMTKMWCKNKVNDPFFPRLNSQQPGAVQA